MYAKITRDHLFDGDIIDDDLTGTQFGDLNDKSETFEFRLLDDDRELYYEGFGTDDSLEVVFGYFSYDSGITSLQTLNGEGKWEDVIS